jgi:hypothetical protein
MLRLHIRSKEVIVLDQCVALFWAISLAVQRHLVSFLLFLRLFQHQNAERYSQGIDGSFTG